MLSHNLNNYFSKSFDNASIIIIITCSKFTDDREDTPSHFTKATIRIDSEVQGMQNNVDDTGPKGSYQLSHLSSAPEHSRLEQQHETLVRIMNGTIVHAPVIDPKRIVDVGCGTGVVTCYLGNRFPDALVWGVDISPVPGIHDKPDNVTFVQGDFLTLAATDDRFCQGSADLVFSRLLYCGMTKWEAYVGSAVKMLRPGGYLEVQEVGSGWYVEGEEMNERWEWLKAYYAALEAKGLDPYCAGKVEGWMCDAGLEGVEVKRFSWPFAKALLDVYEHMLPRVLDGQGYSEGEIRAIVEEAARSLDSEGLCKVFCVTVGRKGR